jgi:UDP-glucose 4-epimerase
MSAVLVTAATTPVGLALVRELIADPDVEHVVAVGIEPWPGDSGDVDEARFSYVRTDLTKERNIRHLLFGVAREKRVEGVVHTALHRSALESGRRVHRLNVETTRHLLRLCERHPTIRRFVYRSYAEVYRHDEEHPNLIAEDQPLELGSEAPQRVRNRVEADLTVCTRMGLSKMSICVLRFAELLAPDSGSQLWDWLCSRACLRPLGYNPMVNVITVEDAVYAIGLALKSEARGVFNIPGCDTLPLKSLVELAGCRDIPLPGPLLSPLYRMRRKIRKRHFRYDMNRGRFHTSDVLDGLRAERELGYQARHPIDVRLCPRATLAG